MRAKPGHPAIIAKTRRQVRIISVSQGFAMVRSCFGQWTYRLDELRTPSGKRFTEAKRKPSQ